MNGNEKLQRVKLALLTMMRHSWEQGVTSHAFIDSGDEDIALLLAHEAVHKQSADGRLAWVYHAANITDPCANGEAVIFAYKKTGDEKYLTAAQKMLHYIDHAPASKDGIQHHNSSQPMIAADCIYMVPPFYAAMGEYDKAFYQFDKRISQLWNAEKHAMNHQYDDQKGFLWRDKRWGAATGWTIAALARVGWAFPNTAHKRKLAEYLEMCVSGLLTYQLPGGLFYDILDEGDTSFVETNCAQMAAYGIFTGIEHGMLDKKYLPAAERMRDAANEKVDAQGLVQGASGSPSFDFYGVSAEAQAFYILMEAARERLG